MMAMNIDDDREAENFELRLARMIVEKTSSNLFLTGRAGTGKTTFLKRLRESCSKRMIVVAPTGIAAINAGGVTIHSFFQLDFAPFIPGMVMKREFRYDRFSREKLNIIRAIDLLVIDEVSMVRADLLEQVDRVLRRHRCHDKPFGGVQLLMIGDLMQLSPVATADEWDLLRDYYKSPYFFDAPSLAEAGFEVVELKTVYRQNDSRFLGLLNAIRDNNISDAELAALNSRCIPGFVPPAGSSYVRLTTHNALARAINDGEMAKLGGNTFSYEARVEGNFMDSAFPADSSLSLKVGAQVMFIKNDSSGERRFYNGMLGTVVALTNRTIFVKPVGDEPPFYVKPEEWVNNRYEINHETNEIKEVIDGKFLQYPLRPAWVITIHKSQGLTFDHAIIDASRSFAHGQVYVALSRCRTLEGMVLDAPMSRSAVIVDQTVIQFVKSHSVINEARLAEMMRRYRVELLDEMFTFSEMNEAIAALRRTVMTNLTRVSDTIAQDYMTESERFDHDVTEVAARFIPLIHQLANAENESALSERVQSAARYFLNSLQPVAHILEITPSDHTNKAVKKRLVDQKAELTRQLTVKNSLLITFMEQPFSPETYLKVKGEAALSDGVKPKKPKKVKEAKPKRVKAAKGIIDRATGEEIFAADAPEMALYNRLVEWRRVLSAELSCPPYVIAVNKAFQAICENLPETTDALRTTPYLSTTTIDRYGDIILDFVHDFKSR
jgi:hypothetical protein